jgi:ferric-dicitrate binding protein FerR (iron transport regulator)
VILKAGQQAQVDQSGHIAVTDPIDISKDIAWKDGFFYFEGLRLDELMRELERWYDIEVMYEGEIPDMQFSGKIGMDINLDNLMKVMGELGVHYRIEGSTVTILP